MSDFSDLQQSLRAFIAERDWHQFHSPKNLSMALAGEAGELVAIFQWLTEAQSEAPDARTLRAAKEEMADVQMYLLALADRLGVDLRAAVEAKMAINASRYPAEKFSGSARKYDAPER